jgi:DNA processing protein
MNLEERDYYLACSVFPGIGPMRFSLLLEAFGSAERLWHTSDKDVAKVGLSESLYKKFLLFRREFSIPQYKESLNRKGIRIVCRCDDTYPSQLASISDPPLVLFIKGHDDISLLSTKKSIAVVGTRKVDSYGRTVTKQITTQLSCEGCTIVSGLALGVDGIAHETALAVGGKTIAVLGCGVDIIAPSSHAYLYNQIIQGHGFVVSEMPPGYRPAKGLFPARNRIISGLSEAVIIVQGTETSGSLITARYAAEQGKEVFAVPGPIFSPLSSGPHLLIQQGAMLIHSAGDVLKTLGYSNKHHVSQHIDSLLQFSQEEQLILQELLSGNILFDDIAKRVYMSVQQISEIITILELSGSIARDEEGNYRLTK